MSGEGHYTIGGKTSAENADTYTITFTLNSNYKWATASEANGNNVEGVLSLDWRIVAKKITRPELTIPEGSLTYTGENLNATLENFDEQAFVIDFAANDEKDNDGMSRNGATLTVLHAGEYTVTVSLNNKDAVNFVWATAGEESEVFKWSVAKATNSVTVDPISGWVYDGTEKKPVFSAERGTPTAAYEYSITKDGNRESGTNVKPINAGYYWMIVSVPDGDDWEGAESEEIQFLISRAKVDSPQAAAAEMYTGGDISLKLTDESDLTADKYEIVSGNVGRDAGGYNARIQLHQNYKWAYDESEYDDNKRDMELSWSIAQRTLNRLALTTERSEVNDNNGSPQSQDNALQNYDETYAAEAYIFGALPEGLQRSGGTLSAVNAGEYSVTVSLSKNFVWGTEGEASYTLKWTIDKKVVTVPKVGIEDGRRLTFNGEEQYPTAIYNDAQNSPYYKSSERGLFWRHNGSGYELIESPVNYGTYYLYLDLKDPENYQWGIVEGDQNGTLDPLYQDSGVDSEDLSEAITLRVWFAISRATYGGSAEMDGWTYGDYTSANAPKPVIDTDIDLIDGAIQGGTLVPQIYYLGIDNDFGAGENSGRGSLTAPQNAGTYRVLVIIGAYGDYDTVSIGGNNEVTFTITPKKLTVTFQGTGFQDGKYSFMYGKAEEARISATGYATNLGDSAANVSVEIEYYTSGGDPLGAFPKTVAQNNYIVTAFTENKNYDIEGGVNEDSRSSISVDYIITPAELTVTVKGQNLTYGDPLGEWDLSATGWVKAYGNEQAQYETDFFNKVKGARALSTLYGAGSSVGKYDIALNEGALTDLGEWAGNYVINYDYDAQIIVTARSLTVEITGGQDSFVYGTVIDYGYNITDGLYRDEDEETFKVVLTYSGTDYASTTDKPQNVGTYTVRVTLEKVGEYVLNYVLNGEVSKTFAITQKPLKIAIGNAGIIYGSDAPESWKVGYEGVLPADEKNIADLVSGYIYCNYEAGYDKGDYTITINDDDLATIQKEAPNYNITKTDGKLHVAQRQITVEIADKTSIYGSAIAEFTASVTRRATGYSKKTAPFGDFSPRKASSRLSLRRLPMRANTPFRASA